MNETLQLVEPETAIASEALPVERLRQSGFIIKPIDKAATLAMLDNILQNSDSAEDRETMEYLTKAIDEQRAAVGARLVFPEGRV